jgi:Uri superfamily endonuclease
VRVTESEKKFNWHKDYVLRTNNMLSYFVFQTLFCELLAYIHVSNMQDDLT